MHPVVWAYSISRNWVINHTLNKSECSWPHSFSNSVLPKIWLTCPCLLCSLIAKASPAVKTHTFRNDILSCAHIHVPLFCDYTDDKNWHSKEPADTSVNVNCSAYMAFWGWVFKDKKNIIIQEFLFWTKQHFAACRFYVISNWDCISNGWDWEILSLRRQMKVT